MSEAKQKTWTCNECTEEVIHGEHYYLHDIGTLCEICYDRIMEDMKKRDKGREKEDE